MSVINKMHHDFRESQKDGPVIKGVPDHSRSKKAIIVVMIGLLILSAMGFAILIFNQDPHANEQSITVHKDNNLDVNNHVEKKLKPVGEIVKQSEVDIDTHNIVKEAVVTPIVSKPTAAIPPVNLHSEKQQPLIKAIVDVETPSKIEQTTVLPDFTPSNVEAIDNNIIETQSVDYVLSDDSTLEIEPTQGKLEIKNAQLTNEELAGIKLKEAQIAEDQGELNIAADKREQALRFDPGLNDVRKSLALYFYGTGNISKAKQLLQTGAVLSPDYAEFNLMLSRLALKEGDPQKAYLYLNQHPPAIKGHLDYYVSYAILAQKFGKYEQSEQLYTRLLSERPNNGRWLMSLAIAQDKQNKVELAASHYKRALLQPDLSEKAKAYINQRIAYLEKSR